MKAKDKKINKITLKKIVIFFAIIISLLYIAIFYNLYFVNHDVYAKETSSNLNPIKISNANNIDIQTIINKNTKEGQKEEYSVQEVELEYLTQYKNNSNLAKGKIQVLQEGREGKQEITTKKVYQDGQLIAEEQISAKVTKAAINKVVEVGTGNYVSNYKIKVGDTLYVTSDRLPVRVEANEDSQKVATLKKDNPLKVLEIQKGWYKISSQGSIGYVKAENTTYIDQTPKQSTRFFN